MVFRAIPRIFLVILLTLPFFGLFESTGLLSDFNFSFDWREFSWALNNTLIQSMGSTFATLAIGVFGSLGLLWLDSRDLSGLRRVCEALLIAPSLMPSLYVILACLQMIDPFPMGLFGIMLVHTMMNFGISAVVFSHLLRQKCGALSEAAAVLGVGFWRFIFRVGLPLLKWDILKIGFFIFAMCFTSFAVPLTVGGGRGTTIEVLIFEKIRFDLNWNQAVTLAFIQIVFLLLLSLIGNQSEATQSEVTQQRSQRSLQILPQWIGLIVVLTLTTWLYGSFFMGIWEGTLQLRQLFEIKEALWNAAINTYFLALFGGLLIGLSYLLLGYLWPDRWLERIVGGFVSPSTVMIGFGLILISLKVVKIDEWVRLCWGLWILFFPTLIRWGGLSELRALEGQLLTAQTLGASRWKIFKEITLPQISYRASWLGGVGGFWIAGEFALSRLLLNQDQTLALIAQSFLASYRLGLGTVLCSLMMLCGLAAFLTIRGCDYVYSGKINR